MSVTADTPEEQEQREEFLQSIDPDLREVVESAPVLFAAPDADPPEREVQHTIRLTMDSVPIKRRPYPLPPPKLEAMRDQMKELIEHNWVEPSESPWGAPVLFVPKKNGQLRMCVDFRDLNSVTIDDSYPLPRLEILLHRAASATVFSKLDLASGFHQISVNPESRPLTAFRLPEAVQGSSLWQWKVMPFGLRNAPPTFQRAMSRALVGCEHCAVVYIDDILIFSKTREEHLEHLRLVFQKLQDSAYHARLEKCEFLQEEVEFLGHRLSKGGISTHPDKVSALINWSAPLKSLAEVRSFMGLAVWYRSFIPHLATVAAPLFELMSIKKKFNWTEEAESAMKQIQMLVSSAPTLARWEDGRETRVITDASKVGIGAVLEQLHEADWRPIAFWSRKLKDAETRYSATDLEWLAAVTAVTRVWYWMLEAQPFTLCSDHKALERKLCKSMHDPPLNDRQSRWIEAMMKFPLTFQWIKGTSNPVADALSRYPAQANAVTVLNTKLVGIWRRLQIAAQDDPIYSKSRDLANDPDTNYSWWRGLVVDEAGRIVVPDDPELKTLLISENHDPTTAGHFGSEKTKELIERYWTWTGLARDVREYIRSCVQCQKQKHSNRPPAGTLYPIIAQSPWQIITMDFMTSMPPAKKTKNTAILAMVDKFSKYVNLEACKETITAAETAAILIRRIVAQYGLPRVVISDRGPQFSSAVWETVLKTMGTGVALASPHHPQTDGQSERAIQVLSRLLRSYTSKAPADWEEQLPLLQFAINNAPSSTTRYSPYQIIYGATPVIPLDFCLSDTAQQLTEVPDGSAKSQEQLSQKWFRTWWKARRTLHSFVRANLAHSAEETKRRYDKKHAPLDLQEGDLVLLSAKSHISFQGVRKHKPRYSGPYVVKRKIHHNAYELSGLPSEVPSTQNVQFLRLFHPTPARFASRPTPEYAVPTSKGTHLEWEVEAIIGHRQRIGAIQYRIKWANDPEATWLWPKNLQGCQQLLRVYQREHQLPLSYWSDDSSSLSTSESDDPGSSPGT